MPRHGLLLARRLGVDLNDDQRISLRDRREFPIDALERLMPRVKQIMVVEASPGQLENELRLALSHAGIATPPISSVQRYGGVLPEQSDIIAGVLQGAAR